MVGFLETAILEANFPPAGEGSLVHSAAPVPVVPSATAQKEPTTTVRPLSTTFLPLKPAACAP